MNESLPVVIIGAGPVGLAAAAHCLARGLTPLVLEAGPSVGHGMRRWGHVRMFSPWAYAIDKQSAALLSEHGWIAPDATRYPTGREVVESYLEPLAAVPELARHIHVNRRVIAVSRQGRDRMKSADRNTAPYLVRYLAGTEERQVQARAVIDASGTLDRPNPIGASGIPALGERRATESITYGLPDVLGAERSRFAGRRVMVVGSGHSAFNVLSDLVQLQAETAAGEIHWAIRRPNLQKVFGGGEQDQLLERGLLGWRIARMVEAGAIQVHTQAQIDRIDGSDRGLQTWSGDKALPVVDELVAATGFRPDLSLLDEVRLDLDPVTQSPSALAPLIDPNVHSCGSVPPHGAAELQHPDRDFYVVGMKSYGRAPTFLLLTGYEQVRSVVAALAGDWEAARRVELVLPETGVCSSEFDDAEPASSCCGAAPEAVAQAGCVGTQTCAIEAKTQSCADTSCGCATPIPAPSRRGAVCCGSRVAA